VRVVVAVSSKGQGKTALLKMGFSTATITGTENG
jgi:hypothetical protein